MALDEFSSYTEALAAWLASNRQDESQLLKGKALEDAKQLVECRSLSEPDYQFLIASQELEKRELLKQLEIDRQATQEVNQQIASFLANTRIELATPINGIICSLKLIIDGLTKSREEEQAFINEAHRSALDTLAQVNGLLDIADLAQLEAVQIYVLSAFFICLISFLHRLPWTLNYPIHLPSCTFTTLDETEPPTAQLLMFYYSAWL